MGLFNTLFKDYTKDFDDVIKYMQEEEGKIFEGLFQGMAEYIDNEGLDLTDLTNIDQLKAEYLINYEEAERKYTSVKNAKYKDIIKYVENKISEPSLFDRHSTNCKESKFFSHKKYIPLNKQVLAKEGSYKYDFRARNDSLGAYVDITIRDIGIEVIFKQNIFYCKSSIESCGVVDHPFFYDNNVIKFTGYS